MGDINRFPHCGNPVAIDKLRGLVETGAHREMHSLAGSPLIPEFDVRNSIAYGWHVASRTAALQIGTTFVVALVVTAGFGVRAGVAALCGGMVVGVGTLLFALRMFGRGVTPVRTALRSAYAAQGLKWFWLCATLYLAIAVFKLPFPGLITGMLAAQFAFWIALIAIR